MIGLMMFQGKRCLELVPSLAASHLKHEDPTLATELLRLLLHVEKMDSVVRRGELCVQGADRLKIDFREDFKGERKGLFTRERVSISR